jgi:hypothetical protein
MCETGTSQQVAKLLDSYMMIMMMMVVIMMILQHLDPSVFTSIKKRNHRNCTQYDKGGIAMICYPP